MRRLFKGQKGVTLVEAVVAIGLVALVAVAVLTTVSQSAVFTGRADDIYTASVLAQSRIDVLKKFPFDEVETVGPEGNPDTDPITGTRINADGDADSDGAFIRATGVYATGETYLLRVKVSVDTVIDDEPSGHPVVMETIFGDIES